MRKSTNIKGMFKSVTAFFICFIMILSVNTDAFAKDSQDQGSTSQPEYIGKLFDKDKIIDINIDIIQTDWDWLMENATLEEYRSCNVTINGTTLSNVGIRPKGNSTLRQVANSDSDRFSFKIDFGEYVDDQTCFGLKKLVLNNMMSDKSYMKEYLSYELFDFIGVASPAYAFANIKVNGKDWGLYLAVEPIEKSFIKRQYGSSDGNLYKPETDEMGGNFGQDGKQQPNDNVVQNTQPQQPGNLMPDTQPQQNGNQLPNANTQKNGVQQPPNGNWQGNGAIQGGMPGGTRNAKGADLKYTGDELDNYSAIWEGTEFDKTTEEDYQKVVEMIKNLNEGTNLEKYLDIDEILRFFAVNTFLVNLDGYAGSMYHNYYLYERDGVFQILPWDLNMSFAGFRMNDGSKAINFPIDIPVTGNLEDAPLIGKLLEVPEYKELYHKYLKEITEKYINSGVYEASINGINQFIDSYVKNDATAFYTYEDYTKSISQMIAFGKDRAASVTAQLSGTQPSTTYGTLATSVDLSLLGGMNMGGDRNGNANGWSPGMGPDQNGTGMVKSLISDSIVLLSGSSNAYVNGQKTSVDPTNPEVGPMLKDGRTLVPVRFITEKLGAQTSWDSSSSTVTVTLGDKTIKLTLGSNKMFVNGKEYILDVPAESINGRTMIPLRAFVETALGKNIFYSNGLIVISDSVKSFDDRVVTMLLQVLKNGI